MHLREAIDIVVYGQLVNCEGKWSREGFMNSFGDTMEALLESGHGMADVVAYCREVVTYEENSRRIRHVLEQIRETVADLPAEDQMEYLNTLRANGHLGYWATRLGRTKVARDMLTLEGVE